MNLSKVSSNWERCDLFEVLETLESGRRPKGGLKNSYGIIPSIGGEHLTNLGGFTFTNMKFISNDFFETINSGKIKKFDILMIKDGYTGRTSFVDKKFPYEKAAVSEHVFILRPNHKVLPKFLYYYLRSNFSQSLIKKKTRGIIPGINKSFVNDFPIGFPKDKKIQEKIVQKLDYLLEQLQEKKNKIFTYNNLDKIKLIEGNYKKQILKNAFSGLLTTQEQSDEPLEKLFQRIMAKNNSIPIEFSDPPEYFHLIPKGWKWVKIGQICQGIVPGRYKPSTFDGDIPWITMPDLDGFYVTKSKRDLGVTTNEAKRVRMKVFPKNTILMSCVGDVGRICITKNKVVPNQQFHGFIPHDKIISEYIAYALLSENDQINKSATQTTVSYLNKTNCNSLFIPLAPLEEQKRIISIIEKKFHTLKLLNEQISKLIQNHNSIKIYLDNLTSSILDSAFSGKLMN